MIVAVAWSLILTGAHRLCDVATEVEAMIPAQEETGRATGWNPGGLKAPTPLALSRIEQFKLAPAGTVGSAFLRAARPQPHNLMRRRTRHLR